VVVAVVIEGVSDGGHLSS